MTSNKTKENVIAVFLHGEIEAVVILEETPVDRYRYPTFVFRRTCSTKAGKKLPPRQNFFGYNTDDIISATKDAGAFIKRYQQNPKVALEELAPRESEQTQVKLAA